MGIFQPAVNAVSSVFTRTGAVVAASGDYTAAQVTNAADKLSVATQAFKGSITVGDLNGGNTFSVNGGNPNEVLISTGAQIFFGSALADYFGIDIAGRLKSNCILQQVGLKTAAIASGALPTVAPASGTAFQCLTTRDVSLQVPVTLTPTAGAAATCAVAISPDNVTFSSLPTITVPAGVALDGFVIPAVVQVPAGWWVKLTATNATLGTGTYY